MIDLDMPKLAREVLRRYAVERVHEKLPVAWYSDGIRRHAEPRDDKAPGQWLLSSNGWEMYQPREYILAELSTAEAFEVME